MGDFNTTEGFSNGTNLVNFEEKGVHKFEINTFLNSFRVGDQKIISNNLTQVAVYRVGQFGAFSQKELQLRPGTYTAVGSRAGYRDVRKEFDVEPGKGPVSVLVQCEEPI